MVNDHLTELTTNIQPVVRDEAMWGGISLTIDYYLTDLIPSDNLITSVRGVVLRHNRVLVVQDEGERYHVVPGGRREKGETIAETLRREILEETGWRITNPLYLGFAHLHHLTPCPPGYKYPYPDFYQLYYTVQAEHFRPEEKLADDDLRNEFVLGVQWMPIDSALELPMDESQYVLLKAARTHRNRT